MSVTASIGKVLFVLSMVNPSGNATYGSDSTMLMDSMDECRMAAKVYMSTKSRVTDVSQTDERLYFEEDIVGINNRFTIHCKPLQEQKGSFF